MSTKIKRATNKLPQPRSQHGNMIIVVMALTMGFLLALLIFSLNYSRMTGSNNEQRSAIEAAALAAAKDLSEIVLNDPNLGYIGLADSAPVGSGTAATDGYYTQVRSINTILATIRLDMIVSEQVNDPILSPVMAALAQQDYTNTLIGATNLADAFADAIQATPAGTYTDCYGNPVNVYNDAVTAYEANQVRMAGSSQYISGSMKLSLGLIQGGAPTNTPVPQPSNLAQVNSDQQYNGAYLSYTNIPLTDPYNGQMNFVFAGVGTADTLVDPNQFENSDMTLPYAVPCLVKAEADQLFNTASKAVVHCMACAEPGSPYDPLPAPGILSIAFPNGMPNGLSSTLTSLSSLLHDPQISTIQVNPQVPVGGDQGGSGLLTPIIWPIGGSSPTISQVASGGYYQWLRCGGSKVNVQSAVDALSSTPPGALSWSAMSGGFAAPPATIGQMYNYQILPNGTVELTLQPRSNAYIYASENQLIAGTTVPFDTPSLTGPYPNGYVATSPGGIQNSTYNVTVKSWVQQLGTIKGGAHAGAPVPSSADTDLDGSVWAAQLAMRKPSTNDGILTAYEVGGSGYGCGWTYWTGDNPTGPGWGGGPGGVGPTPTGERSPLAPPVMSPVSGPPINVGAAAAAALSIVGTPLISFPSGSNCGTAGMRTTYQHNGLDTEVCFQLADGGP